MATHIVRDPGETVQDSVTETLAATPCCDSYSIDRLAMGRGRIEDGYALELLESADGAAGDERTSVFVILRNPAS